uniref:Uncharacterized protein n=1 Tax=Anguilla anguilla TaxID=7936 RepID=A0A0E9T3P1_ANGAN
MLTDCSILSPLRQSPSICSPLLLSVPSLLVSSHCQSPPLIGSSLS